MKHNNYSLTTCYIPLTSSTHLLIRLSNSGFSRLETILEVPLNRKNGSESWFGQRRFKRFMEFLDAGEVRRPKKPLVRVGTSGYSSSRKRRGAFARDKPPLSVQDSDSLLCAKLHQLNLWLIHDQNDRWQLPLKRLNHCEIILLIRIFRMHFQHEDSHVNCSALLLPAHMIVVVK